MTIIFLLSSKAGIIGIYLSLIFLLLFRLIKSSIRWSFVLILLSVIVLFFISFKANKRFESFPSALVNAKENSKTEESSAVRILIWQSAIDLIKHNYLAGVGTGDVKDSLMSEYKQRNMTGAYKQWLNVHNQFLETFVGQGILGDMILLLLFIYPFIQSLKKQNYLFVLFLVLIGINFLFESMLNRQAGVLFFAFFYSFFVFVEYKEKFSV